MTGAVMARALESSFAVTAVYVRAGFPRILDTNCVRMLQLTVFGR